MKQLLIFTFLMSGLLGFGQSKKQINRQLTAEYHSMDLKVDSLLDVYGFEKARENQLTDSFKIITRAAYEKENVFNELMADLGKKSSDLKLLGVKSFDGMKTSDVDSLLKLLSTETVSTIISRANNSRVSTFFGFSKYVVTGLDSYSKKDQNSLLGMLIEQREKESELLIKYIAETRQYKPSIHETDSALNYLNLFREFLTPNLNKIQEMLDTELSKQRMTYMETGPTGFPLNYHRVFPDVFPETGPDIDYNNQVLQTDAVKGAEPGTVFTAVDEQAHFPGNNTALMNFMRNNLHYPLEAKDKDLEGKCYVKFLVSDSGKISGVSVLKGVPDCEICDKEAVRFVKSMPDWVPAKIGGQPVNSYFTMPILFKLN